MNTTEAPRTEGRVKGSPRIGEYVQYSDIANQNPKPLRVAGTHTNRWGTDIVLVDENGVNSTSDCRQHGWEFVPAPQWADKEFTPIPLADGSTFYAIASITDRFRGLDNLRNVVIAAFGEGDGEYLVPLTHCCNASGKGMDYASGVGCRGCYREVSPYFGGPALVTTPRA